LQHVAASKTMGLILLPTRELAIQVEETIRKLAGASGLRTAIVIGGANPRPQIRQLRAKPHVIVATPGRLIDHIEQGNINLHNIGILVLDEADRMMDMGFAPQLELILQGVPDQRQTMLFSATMPKAIADMAQKYMKSPLRIEVTRPGTTAENIDQEVFIVHKDDKMALMERLLKEYKGTVLIFSRTKHGAKKIARAIRLLGHTADEIHSNRTQSQRQSALRGFTNGKYRILVATDIASRGIDVKDIELVLNFDLPDQLEDYVHRIGRTGRAGKSGKAITFACPDQKREIYQIQQLIDVTLPIKSPSGEAMDPIKPLASGQRSSSGGSYRRGPQGRGGSRPSQGRSGGYTGNYPKRSQSGSQGGRSQERSGGSGSYGASRPQGRSGGSGSGSYGASRSQGRPAPRSADRRPKQRP